jgi:hypothetical protein
MAGTSPAMTGLAVIWQAGSEKRAPPGRGETGRGLGVRPPLQQAGRGVKMLYSIT